MEGLTAQSGQRPPSLRYFPFGELRGGRQLKSQGPHLSWRLSPGTVGRERGRGCQAKERRSMTLSTILIVLLVLALLGAVPVWGYNRSWGYAPSGVVGVLLVILLILALTGGLGWEQRSSGGGV